MTEVEKPNELTKALTFYHDPSAVCPDCKKKLERSAVLDGDQYIFKMSCTGCSWKLVVKLPVEINVVYQEMAATRDSITEFYKMVFAARDSDKDAFDVYKSNYLKNSGLRDEMRDILKKQQDELDALKGDMFTKYEDMVQLEFDRKKSYEKIDLGGGDIKVSDVRKMSSGGPWKEWIGISRKYIEAKNAYREIHKKFIDVQRKFLEENLTYTYKGGIVEGKVPEQIIYGETSRAKKTQKTTKTKTPTKTQTKSKTKSKANTKPLTKKGGGEIYTPLDATEPLETTTALDGAVPVGHPIVSLTQLTTPVSGGNTTVENGSDSSSSDSDGEGSSSSSSSSETGDEVAADVVDKNAESKIDDQNSKYQIIKLGDSCPP